MSEENNQKEKPKKKGINFKMVVLVLLVLGVLYAIGQSGLDSAKEKAAAKKDQQGEQAVTNVADSQPQQQPAQAVNKTLEQKVTDAITDSLGLKNNMSKPRVVSVMVDKYTADMLSTYDYQGRESVVSLLIKINASENLTTNLQKGTMADEAVKIAQAVFPIDDAIGDITIWSQLPIKDQYGNIKDNTAIVFSMARPLFDKINWNNFSHRDLPDLLRAENRSDDRNNYVETVKFD